MHDFSYTSAEIRLAKLLSARRLRFHYLNSTSGKFLWKKFGLVLINTFASSLTIPLLFFICYYTFSVFPHLLTRPFDVLSGIFFMVPAIILFDVFMGFIYDQLSKARNGNNPRLFLKGFLSVVGNIGLALTAIFFFRKEKDPIETVKQFKITIGLAVFFLNLSNTTNFKNSINYSPSQDERRSLFHLEYFIKGFITFIYAGLPFMIKFWTSDCDCQDLCHDAPAATDCLTCLNTCDTITSMNYYRFTTIGFLSFFTLANLITQFAVKPRRDESHEDIPTTFNRRLIEIYQNKLLLKSFVITVLEYAVFFGLAIWTLIYINFIMTPTESCRERMKDFVYFCTDSFWNLSNFFLMFLFSGITFLLSRKIKFILFLSIVSSLLAVAAGIFLLVPTFEDDNTVFYIILGILAFVYASLPGNKLVYSDATFYDEFKSGSTQSHLPSSLHLLGIKLGFLLSYAIIFTSVDTDKNDPKKTGFHNADFGIIIIAVASVLTLLKFWTSLGNLHQMDKIQIAIERNKDAIHDDINFYDPLTQRPIQAPIISSKPVEKKLIKFMYSLRENEMDLIIRGKQEKVQSEAGVKLGVFFVIAVAISICLIIFGSYFDTYWNWVLFIGLVLIPICLLIALYEYNVWASAGALESSKYKSVDQNVLMQFVSLIEQ